MADDAGKALQSTVRPELNKVVRNATVTSQWGSGLHGGATDIVNLYMNAAVDSALSSKKSVALLFVDIKTAYASVQRSLFLETHDQTRPDMHRDSYIKRLVELGFTNSDATEIFEDASRMHQWIEAGGPEQLLEHIKNLHRGSWFSTEGHEGVFIPTVGALAGTPFADLLFTFAAAKVMKQNLMKMIGEVFGTSLSQADSWAISQIYEISFVDDGVWTIIDKADMLINSIRKVMEILDRVFTSFGFVCEL